LRKLHMRRPVYEIQEGSCLVALQVEVPFAPGTFWADGRQARKLIASTFSLGEKSPLHELKRSRPERVVRGKSPSCNFKLFRFIRFVSTLCAVERLRTLLRSSFSGSSERRDVSRTSSHGRSLAMRIGGRLCWKNDCRRNSACRRKCSRIWNRQKTTRRYSEKL
jgi:hypothetical protein